MFDASNQPAAIRLRSFSTGKYKESNMSGMQVIVLTRTGAYWIVFFRKAQKQISLEGAARPGSSFSNLFNFEPDFYTPI